MYDNLIFVPFTEQWKAPNNLNRKLCNCLTNLGVREIEKLKEVMESHNRPSPDSAYIRRKNALLTFISYRLSFECGSTHFVSY